MAGSVHPIVAGVGVLFQLKRLRFFYVEITRAKRELIVTWNTAHYLTRNVGGVMALDALCWHDIELAN